QSMRLRLDGSLSMSALRRSSNIYTDQQRTAVIETVFDEVTKTLSSISVDYH
ncbi:hypothetical protein Tco_1232523, partial [Tanacetum coccineum]